MNLSELKREPVQAISKIAQDMGIENVAGMRKQDMTFAILKAHAKKGEDIFGGGTLEILPDGFGFFTFSG